jgi:hypothetical protein
MNPFTLHYRFGECYCFQTCILRDSFAELVYVFPTAGVESEEQYIPKLPLDSAHELAQASLDRGVVAPLPDILDHGADFAVPASSVSAHP